MTTLHIAVCPVCQHGLTDSDKAKGFVALPSFQNHKRYMHKFSWLKRTAAAGCPLCTLLLHCIMRKVDEFSPAEELNLELVRNRRLVGLRYNIKEATSESAITNFSPSPELEIVSFKGPDPPQSKNMRD